MRDLHGVIGYDVRNPGELRKYALLFDKLHIVRLDELIAFDPPAIPPHTLADLAFLSDQGFVTSTPIPSSIGNQVEASDDPWLEYLNEEIEKCASSKDIDVAHQMRLIYDYVARHVACHMVDMAGNEIVPIMHSGPRVGVGNKRPGEQDITVLQVATDFLSVPSDSCAWQDILDFKAEMRDKQWGFRRFLHALASKSHTEAEIRDDIEWSLNEYSKAMNLHRVKASQSFIDVFVISPLEIIENLVKFNWSKIAKGALQVQKRKVELMEAEMKAPGRECAYVFDARKRFGEHGV